MKIETSISLIERGPQGLCRGAVALVIPALLVLSVGLSAEEADDPFKQATNAPGETMILPGQSQPAPAISDENSIAGILREVDPDLEQIQAQIEAGEYEIPKLWLNRKIEDIESDSHRFDPRLVRPITMLGDIQVLEGDYVGALDNYGRAVHLERVNAGLVSAGQIEIVYREAEVYRTLGDLKTANEREEYAYHVLQKAHDPHSENMLPGLFHLAQWYERTHNIFAARHLYQRATDVYIANGKGRTMEAVPAWEGLARSYRMERFPPVYFDPSDGGGGYTAAVTTAGYGVSVNNFPAGERALQTIIQIHRDNGSATPVVAQSVLNLADWHLLFERHRDAFPLYQIAYEMMAGVDGFPVADFFGQPKLIHFPAPVDPSPPDDMPASPVDGLVSVQFNVNERGATRRLQTVDSQPQGMMDFRVRKSLRISRFRPALADGKPVETEDYVYTHRFSYYPQLTMTESTEEASP
jgi:tetratricopeptide (TPR) repeat protein